MARSELITGSVGKNQERMPASKASSVGGVSIGQEGEGASVKAILDFIKQTDQTEDIVIDLKNKIDKLEIGFDKKLEEALNKTNERFDQKIEASKNNNIATMGTLIGLFTFVSVEFQIFRSEFLLQEAAGLSLIIFGCMLFFVSAIEFLIKMDIPILEEKVVDNSNSPLTLRSRNDLSSEKKVEWNSKGLWIRAILPFVGIVSITSGVYLFGSGKTIKATKTDKQKVEINNQGAVVELHRF